MVAEALAVVAVFLGMIFWLQIVRFSCSLWDTGGGVGVGGGGVGGGGGGGGGGSGVGGGPGFSRDNPLLTVRFLRLLKRCYGWTDQRPTDGPAYRDAMTTTTPATPPPLLHHRPCYTTTHATPPPVLHHQCTNAYKHRRTGLV